MPARASRHLDFRHSARSALCIKYDGKIFNEVKYFSLSKQTILQDYNIVIFNGTHEIPNEEEGKTAIL